MLSDARLDELIKATRKVAANWADFDADQVRKNPEYESFVNQEVSDHLSALTELQEARKLYHAVTCPGPTHHEQCACSVKRRIEAMGKGEIDNV